MVTPEATMNPNVQIMVRLTTINGSTSPTSVRKRTERKIISIMVTGSKNFILSAIMYCTYRVRMTGNPA